MKGGPQEKGPLWQESHHSLQRLGKASAPASYGERGAPVAAPGPRVPDLWALRLRWLEWLHLLACLVGARPSPALSSLDGPRGREAPAPTPDHLGLRVACPALAGGGTPGLGRPGSPSPPVSDVFRAGRPVSYQAPGALWALPGGSELPGRK